MQSVKAGLNSLRSTLKNTSKLTIAGEDVSIPLPIGEGQPNVIYLGKHYFPNAKPGEMETFREAFINFPSTINKENCKIIEKGISFR